MPKAGTTETLTLYRTDAAGAAVSGKVEADFAFVAHHDGVAHALTTSGFAEIADGYYSVAVTYPATLGRLRIDASCLNPTTDTVDPEVLEGQVTANDIDSVAVLAARPPSVTLAQNVSPQSAFGITVFKGDARTLRIPCYDDDGNTIDLSLWENFRFSIQNTDQSTVTGDLPYHQTTGVDGGADGFAEVVLPEDCTAYGVHTTRADTKLWWSLDANTVAGGVTKTRTLRAGVFTIRSKETPSP